MYLIFKILQNVTMITRTTNLTTSLTIPTNMAPEKEIEFTFRKILKIHKDFTAIIKDALDFHFHFEFHGNHGNLQTPAENSN